MHKKGRTRPGTVKVQAQIEEEFKEWYIYLQI